MFIKAKDIEGDEHVINTKYIVSFNSERVDLWQDSYLDIDKTEYDYLVSKLSEIGEIT